MATEMDFSTEELKQALGRWISGVAVVTTRAGGRIHGMTARTLTEVSLDPPMLLFCVSKTANTLSMVGEGGVFAVNVLAHDLAELSATFASKNDEWRRFDGVEFETGATGAPLIVGAVCSFDCRVEACHDHGDHVVVVGSIEHLRSHERPALVYGSGSYGRFLTE